MVEVGSSNLLIPTRRGKEIGDSTCLETNMDSKKKGSISEQKATVKLMELGYNISKPVSEHCRYDLIIDNGDELNRVQVKSGRKRNGCVVFNTSDVRSNKTENNRKTYTEEDIDSFLCVCDDDMFLVDIDDAPKTEMSIRVEEFESKYASSENTNWAENFQIPEAR